MEYTLYRNMSTEEASNVLTTGLFTKPVNKIYLPRKWFSTSLFRSHYFKSPFYTGDTTILKVLVNEEFFHRIFEQGTFILREPNGFYGYNESKDEILYAKAHKTIDTLYNVGFLDLDKLNNAISSIGEIKDDNYCTYLEQDLLHQELKNVERLRVDGPLDFYFQVSYDIAILLLKYQTLMVEAINPVIKTLHFSKSITDLKRKNLDKYSVTLRMRFKSNVKNYTLYHEEFMSLNYNEIFKFLPFIESINLADLQPPREFKEYLHIKGDNEYTKHERCELGNIERLSFQEFESVTQLLFQKRVNGCEISAYLPFLEDMKNINQVDPRHIDNVDTHVWKTLDISNLVINYFKNQGVILDATSLVYLKWVLLLHDAGKPYCECNNITTRYSQFGDKEKYTNEIMEKVLDPEVYFDISSIYRIFNLSSLAGHKKINRLIHDILNDIQTFYKVSQEEAFNILKKYLQIALIAKVSHTASLKPHSYCCSYVDDIMYFDRVNDILINLKNNSFIFPYDEYYANVDNSYDAIVEPFYKTEEPVTLIDKVREINKLDYNDLSISYHNKSYSLDDIQLDPDELVAIYFKEDNEFIKKYFMKELTSSNAHGDMHCSRVLTYNYLMARINGLNEEDTEILSLASLYHDIGRNSKSSNHARVGVDTLNMMNIIPESISSYVYFLVEAHGVPDKDIKNVMKHYQVDEKRAMTLINIFKDADALDRVRFDIMESSKSALDISYLRTDTGRRLIKFANYLNAVFKIDVLDINPSVKSLLKV